jgi:type IV pilus assembly protein PilA
MQMRQKGFTLIELMIVVAIMGILASFAIPAYKDYLVRSRVSAAFVGLEPAKLAVQEYYSLNGEMPSNNSTAGLDTVFNLTGYYIKGVEVQRDDANTAVITAILDGNKVQAGLSGDPTIILLGSGSPSTITFSWSCYYEHLLAKQIPLDMDCTAL